MLEVKVFLLYYLYNLNWRYYRIHKTLILNGGVIRIFKLFIIMIGTMLLVTSFACQNETAEGEHEYGEEGEESGTQYALSDTCDEVYNGVRLIMSYNKQSKSFNGTVENTTEKTLKKVRVEVHLSNGVELGPTTPADLEPAKNRDVNLTATGKDFEWWTAHPEVGSDEHGENEGENDREGDEHEDGHEGEHK